MKKGDPGYEEVLKRNREHYRKNREARLLKAKKDYLLNKDQIRERQAEYHQRTKEDRRVYRLAVKANRRAAKVQAMPKWADKDEIQKVYALAKERGLAVDHIVPLVSDEVCGLHTPDNLRCIPHKLNRIKGNRYWSNMWDEQLIRRVLS